MTEGRLVYVVGASGVGKDSVLAGVREALRGADRVVVAHRYITRPATSGAENHVALSEEEFRLRREAGCFALCWESHGLCYGIGREVGHWVESGLTVLVNGSRAYWPQARVVFPEAQLVEITASDEAIRRRIAGRRRESEAAQRDRMRRNRLLSEQPLPADRRISNEGQLEQAVGELLGWLRSGRQAG